MIKFEVVPPHRWVEGDEEGLTYPELRCITASRAFSIPMVDTKPETVALAMTKAYDWADDCHHKA